MLVIAQISVAERYRVGIRQFRDLSRTTLPLTWQNEEFWPPGRHERWGSTSEASRTCRRTSRRDRGCPPGWWLRTASAASWPTECWKPRSYPKACSRPKTARWANFMSQNDAHKMESTYQPLINLNKHSITKKNGQQLQHIGEVHASRSRSHGFETCWVLCYLFSFFLFHSKVCPWTGHSKRYNT